MAKTSTEWVEAEWVNAGGAQPLARGASLTTDKHVDPAAAVKVLRDDASHEEDVPEGLVRFDLDAKAIEVALAAPSLEV